MKRIVEDRRHRLALLTGQLEGLSPLKKLSQGYSYVADADGVAVTDAGRVSRDDLLSIQLLKGRLTAKVTEVYDE